MKRGVDVESYARAAEIAADGGRGSKGSTWDRTDITLETRRGETVAINTGRRDFGHIHSIRPASDNPSTVVITDRRGRLVSSDSRRGRRILRKALRG